MTLPFKKQIRNFLIKDKYLPLIAGLASGLYPWAFYFTNNFDFVNSWDHFFFFLNSFIVLPTIVYYVFFFVMRKKYLPTFKNIVLPTLNALVFFTLTMLALFAAIRWKHAVLIAVLTGIIFIGTLLTKKMFSKILVLQFLMLITTTFAFTRIINKHFKYSYSWLNQPDTIKNVIFKKKPNVYVIQADGYVNFSELKNGYYNFDNSDFENWLTNLNFEFYKDFRSNYKNTIYSNSSMFSMKHHYYDTYNERSVIMHKNAVVSIFNSNFYKTHLFVEAPYFIINRPKNIFNFTNYKQKELPYISRGLSKRKDIILDFKKEWPNRGASNFYFFEKLLPWHITVPKKSSRGTEKEREVYLENLKKSNEWIKELISLILENDAEALIVLSADHGGFVGMNSTSETLEKMTDRDKIYSIF